MGRAKTGWLVLSAVVLSLVALLSLYRAKTSRMHLQEVAIDHSGGGLVAVTLPVTAMSCEGRGGCVVKAEGLYKGQSVGMKLIFASGMRQSVFTDRVSTTQIYPAAGGITLVFEGSSGKSLIRLMAESYGLTARSVNLPQTVKTTAISLLGDPARIETRPLKFKVVHAGDKDSRDYFELLVDSDLADDKVQIGEKDIDYRAAVLRSLSGQ